MNRNELPFEPRHLGVPSGVSKTISEPMIHLTQIVQLSCTETNIILKKGRNEILHDPRRLGVPSGASKTVSEAMVHLVQTVDLSFTDTNAISKQTKMRFYVTHVTLEFHRVRPK
jgi:hypothetical protein